MPDETLIRLRMLTCPEVRREAGFPETGPLSVQQIADFSGLSKTSVQRIMAGGLRKLRSAAINAGIAPSSDN